MTETLNPAQLRAVHHLRGPCLVLAGAGSGKTRVIAHKIVRLLQHGLEPSQIAAITFTNKAAQEMRERARALAGPKAARELLVATFHALGVRMLREDGERIGLKPSFSILDADDVLGLLREAGGCSDNARARRWQWAISRWKNQGLDADGAAAAATDADEQQAARLMRQYQDRLAAYQAVDFDDLIALPLALLRRDPEARAKWRQRLHHVLVDEVQDTNVVQYELLRELVGERARFTAVGDDDQSIYGWRGATLDNLKRLAEDFPALQVIPLEQNYRSTGHILRAANAVIANNPKLFDKTLWSELGDGESVRVVECDGEEHEAERAVARIQALRAAGAATRLADFAILYRANHQSRAFEHKLRAAQIPYKVSGGQSFFDRAEIKDLVAWLRLLVNEDDDPAFLRAATTPRRGIGHQTLVTLGARALLLAWLTEIGYEQHLHDGADSQALAVARWTNVIDFVDWIARRCEADDDAGRGRGNVLQVAQTINVILSLAERGDDADVVTLSTLHAAKGLEWPHVVLAGVVEGLLPFRADGEALSAERLHEERRLMYVGITRAQRTLLVSTLRRRKRGRETVPAQPSRFVAEMKLDAAVVKYDPRERLKRLRAELAARVPSEETPS